MTNPTGRAADSAHGETMDIDTLTIGEAKRLAAALAPLIGAYPPAAPQPTESPYAAMIGRPVLVRAHRAGVWAGPLTRADGDRLTLAGARRLWHWTGALECSVLAQRGPATAKLGDATTVILGPSAEVLEIHAMTDAAWSVVRDGASWAR